MVRSSLLRLSEAVATQVPSRLPPLPSPRDLLKLYKIKAQRFLSQNFLLDSRLCNKLVTKSGNVKDCWVCEVGPGPGNITRAILQNGAERVLVIEKDKRFLPALEFLADASNGRMKIILGDIMDLNLENVLPKELGHDWNIDPPPLYIMGNLPFNISTPLAIRWLRQVDERKGPFAHGRTRLTLTFQKEVADRMEGLPGTSSRSRLSIMCQYLCHVDNLFTIPGRAFFPKPDVDVSVVKLTPRIKPLIHQPYPLVDKLVTTLFHHKQKYCRYGVMNLFPMDRPDLSEKLFEETKINPEKRSFELEVEEFKTMCDVYSAICQDNDGIYEYNYQIHKKKKPKDKAYLESDDESIL